MNWKINASLYHHFLLHSTRILGKKNIEHALLQTNNNKKFLKNNFCTQFKRNTLKKRRKKACLWKGLVELHIDLFVKKQTLEQLGLCYRIFSKFWKVMKNKIIITCMLLFLFLISLASIGMIYYFLNDV